MNSRKPPVPPRKQPSTDWSEVADWYDELVGESGSEYHREVVLPGVLKLLGPPAGQNILDIACGQGVLCRLLHAKGATATGVDSASQLIRLARERSDPAIKYYIGDARDLKFILERRFDAAACMLAIQNIHPISGVFESIQRVLVPGGRLVMVMMHPCFRGPKYTSWGWEGNTAQYRRVDRYLIPRKEPIVTHPGKDAKAYTWTFHRPLQAYIKALRAVGLLVDAIEEWPSHKMSEAGPRASAENLARKEIPMFMAIRAVAVPNVTLSPEP